MSNQIIQQLEDIRRSLPNLTEEIRDAEDRLARATRHLKESEAHAYLDAKGAIKEREFTTTISVSRLIEARDDAQAVVRYLKMRRADLELLQTNLQSTAKLMEMPRASTQ